MPFTCYINRWHQTISAYVIIANITLHFLNGAYIVSSTCVLRITALKIRIVNAHLLCVLDPIVLHCNTV